MSVPQLEFSPLLDWVEGRLPPRAAQEIELLLANGDTQAEVLVAWLRNFHRARTAVTLGSPPPAVTAALRERFAAYAAARRQPGLREWLAAVVSFDSLTQLSAAGTRTAESGMYQPRQLIFSCAVADIALHVHSRPHDDQIDLNGQILPHSTITLAGWGVLLIGDSGPDATHTDELGEFGFEGIRPGDYTISVETTRLAITMPMVSLVR